MSVLIAARPLVLEPEQIHLIARGRITLLLLPSTGEVGEPAPYRAGTRVALQRAHGETARAWVNVEHVDPPVALGELTDDQVAALGHRDIYALQAAWRERGQPWDPRARVWLLRIEHDDSAPPRLLHRDSSHAYTEDPLLALRGEQEAVDDFALAAAQRAAHAREHAEYEQRRAERRRLPLEDQLKLALRDCAARGVPDSGPRNAIVKQIEVLERRAIAPADRTRDAEIRAPEEDDTPRRPRRRPNPEAAARRRRDRDRKKPGPLSTRRVDPTSLPPRGIPLPRAADEAA